MAPRKASTTGKGALEGFKAVNSIPPAVRSSWATKALSQFLESEDNLVACEYETDKAAISKQASLTKAAKGEAFAGRVKVHRRGNTIYLERL